MGEKHMLIRHAKAEDVPMLAEVEAACFPPAEAASEAAFRERVAAYGNHFWLMFEGRELIGFIDGMVTTVPDLWDEMYEDAALHDATGEWQMIFGLNTLPARRRQGYAARLIEALTEQARQERRRGVVLTCKEALLPYYEKFGFINEGISSSVHGNAVWYQMRLTF